MQIQLPEKLYYTIGETAKAFQVNTSLIRFWEKEFDILQPKKNKKGNRLFTPKDVKNLQTIYHLVKEKGYTLEGAKIALNKENNLDKKIDILSKLEFIRTELLEIKTSLDEN
jgi:DNA-binding transcriptional MerR regulator